MPVAISECNFVTKYTDTGIDMLYAMQENCSLN